VPTRESTVQRAARRTRSLLHRTGEELRTARVGAGLSTRSAARFAGISHTQVRRIESGLAPHVDLAVLGRLAAVLGHELSLGIHPVGPPVRDAGHLALLARFRARLHPSIRWRSEVPVPLQGDRRSADAMLTSDAVDALVEAETRLDDIQAVERRIRAKQRDIGVRRAILLVAAGRHNRAVIAAVPDLLEAFPIGTRTCLAALACGEDPDGDCLVML
jgi:transcriptional regulator with XRE-family HTH domain